MGKIGYMGTILLVLLGLGKTAIAAEAGHGPSEWADLFYRILNFGLMVVILVFVLRKTTIKDYFAIRREELKRKMEQLQREKDALEARYRELEAKLKETELTRAQILEEYRREGEIEKAKIIENAQQRARYIMAQAESTIQRELQSAKDRLMAEVMAMAARRAEELLAKEIKDTDQERLVGDFIERVGKLH